MIILIFASDLRGIIGKNDKLPWPPLRGELKRFKDTTIGNTVVMGRNTFQTLPNGPLTGRRNIILTKKITFQDRWKSFKFNVKNIFSDTRLEFKTNVNDILYEYHYNQFGPNMFIIGGASIYRQFEEHCEKMIWTQVKEFYEGDTMFVPSQYTWQNVREEDFPEYKILIFKKRCGVFTNRK